MPALASHQAKAEHNLAFAGSIDVLTPYRDWIVTALFYSALHFASALLHKLNYSDAWHDDHGKMLKLFAIAAPLRHETQLRDDYKQLRDDRWEAQYNMREFTRDEVETLRSEVLPRLRQRVAELMQ
jgi:uncharacterized protein (UPF0332 family)